MAPSEPSVPDCPTLPILVKSSIIRPSVFPDTCSLTNISKNSAENGAKLYSRKPANPFMFNSWAAESLHRKTHNQMTPIFFQTKRVVREQKQKHASNDSGTSFFVRNKNPMVNSKCVEFNFKIKVWSLSHDVLMAAAVPRTSWWIEAQFSWFFRRTSIIFSKTKGLRKQKSLKALFGVTDEQEIYSSAIDSCNFPLWHLFLCSNNCDTIWVPFVITEKPAFAPFCKAILGPNFPSTKYFLDDKKLFSAATEKGIHIHSASASTRTQGTPEPLPRWSRGESVSNRILLSFLCVSGVMETLVTSERCVKLVSKAKTLKIWATSNPFFFFFTDCSNTSSKWQQKGLKLGDAFPPHEVWRLYPLAKELTQPNNLAEQSL